MYDRINVYNNILTISKNFLKAESDTSLSKGASFQIFAAFADSLTTFCKEALSEFTKLAVLPVSKSVLLKPLNSFSFSQTFLQC